MPKKKTVQENCDVLVVMEVWLAREPHLKLDTGEEI